MLQVGQLVADVGQVVELIAVQEDDAQIGRVAETSVYGFEHVVLQVDFGECATVL